MKPPGRKSLHRIVQFTLGCAAGILCVSVPAAPLLARNGQSLGAALIYVFFSTVCHQIPERSFTLSGYPWAVCHRCTGIYMGLFVASILPVEVPAFFRRPLVRRAWVSSAIALMILDVGLASVGLWTSTSFSRFLIGSIFGAMIAVLMLEGIPEILREALWRRNVKRSVKALTS